MPIKYVDIEYLRAQNANAGQLIMAGTSNTLTYTQYVTVDINGNVGIGTGVPLSTLQVQGNIQLSGAGSTVVYPDGSTQSTASFPSSGPQGSLQFAGASNSFASDSNLSWDTSTQRLGVGTSQPLTTLQVNYTAYESRATSFTGTSTVVIDTFPATLVRSAWYFVQVTDEDNSQYHTAQILVVQDGAVAYKTEYAIVVSASKLGNFDADIGGGNLRLLFNAFDDTNKTVKVTRTSMTA